MTNKLKKNVNQIMRIAIATVVIILASIIAISGIREKNRLSLNADLSITVDGSTSEVLSNQINESSKIVRRKSLLCILNSRSEKYMDGDITAMDS